MKKMNLGILTCTLWFFLQVECLFAQPDTMICDQCNFKELARFIKSQSSNLYDSTKIIKVYDYSMTYLNSIRVQRYLDDKDALSIGPTYSTRFKNKYYRKIYSKLKLCDSIEYISKSADPHLELGIDLIYTLSDRSKVLSKEEVEVFNQLVLLRNSDNYDIPNAEIYLIFDYILSLSDKLNFFRDKALVLSVCENFLRYKGKEWFRSEDKFVIVYVDR